MPQIECPQCHATFEVELNACPQCNWALDDPTRQELLAGQQAALSHHAHREASAFVIEILGVLALSALALGVWHWKNSSALALLTGIVPFLILRYTILKKMRTPPDDATLLRPARQPHAPHAVPTRVGADTP